MGMTVRIVRPVPPEDVRVVAGEHGYQLYLGGRQ